MLKAAIFDVDGTLIDSVPQHAAAWQDTLRHFGKDVTFDLVRRQVGKGDDQLLPVFFSQVEVKALSKDIAEYRSALFKSTYLPQVKPFPQVRRLLERLRADGIRLALASSASREDLQTYEDIADIGDLIEHEASRNDARHSKPHPDIFLAALDRLCSVLPGEAVAIGDTPWDSMAACSLGLSTIGVMSGGWSARELSDAGCCAVYKDAGDLLQHYDGSPFTAVPSSSNATGIQDR